MKGNQELPWMLMIAEGQKWVTGLAIAVLIYGAVVLFAYIAGWVSPRTCEGLSSVRVSL